MGSNAAIEPVHPQSEPRSRLTATGGSPAPFIIGMERSGTTLLRLLLDAHPDLALPSETGFGVALDAIDWRAAGPDELLEAITALPTWPDLAVSRDELAAAFAGVADWS